MRKKLKNLIFFLFIFIILDIFLIFYILQNNNFEKNNTQIATPFDLSAIAEQCSKSVVLINTDKMASSDNWKSNRFVQPNNGHFGSGVIVSSDGLILTNLHVIKDSKLIKIRLKNDNHTYTGTIIGLDENLDIAILKIDAKRKLPKIKLASSSTLKMGDGVFLIGNPFGFEQTIATGIVSTNERYLPHGKGVRFIQSNTILNLGDSGSPLFNLKGEVVGINSQIFTTTGNFMGFSFAIPIELILDLSKNK